MVSVAPPRRSRLKNPAGPAFFGTDALHGGQGGFHQANIEGDGHVGDGQALDGGVQVRENV